MQDEDQTPTEDDDREITVEMIARRAYELSLSGKVGTAPDNWRRAEQELREETSL